MSVFNQPPIVLPQPLGPTASPTFAGLNVTGPAVVQSLTVTSFSAGTVVSSSLGVLSIGTEPAQSSISLAATSSQIITSSVSAHPTTISVPTAATTQTLTVPDAGTTGAASILLSNTATGSQTITDSITVSNTFSTGTHSATVGSLSCTAITSSGTLSATAGATIGSLSVGAITSSGTLSATAGATIGSLSVGAITSSGSISNGTNSLTSGSIISSGSISNGTNSLTSGAVAATSIQFAGTQSALNAYVAGSWTPTLAFGGSSTGITYGRQVGTYIRIGNTVTVNVDVLISSKGSATGAATVTGLPYLPIGGVTGPFTMMPCLFVAMNADPTYTTIVGLLNAGNGPVITPFELSPYSTSTAPVQLTDAHFTTASELIFSGTYITAASP